MPKLQREGAQKKLSKRDLSRNRLENFKKEVDTDCHTIPLDQLCRRLDANTTTGLTKEHAKTLLARTGPNTLTPSTRTPEYVKFIKNLFHGFSILLWFGSLLCFIAAVIQYIAEEIFDLDNIILGVVLIIVVLVTGFFMYYQEHKSSKIMDSFANMIPLKATVVRDGETITILSKDLVLGDLVEIKFGDRIPADIRIIKSQGFKVDNSSLTGESEPLLRTPECTNNNILETKNLAFFSTNAVEGTARGIVVACGDNTVMGRIAGLTARLKPNKTPIARELEYFMKIVSMWACFLGIVFGGAAIAMDYTWTESALFLIGIIVANVPEGLLATVTVCLTVTAKRMASKNCLVKNLEAVETLGSTSTICSDKTGTLTQNRMTVCHLWFNSQTYTADNRPDQINSSKYKSEEGFKSLMRCATLCNRAEFVPGSEKLPIHRREVRGDASEAAILKFVEISQVHGPLKDYKQKHPKLIEVPFSSSTKFQVSVHGLEEGSCIVVMKGAPERIIERCKTILVKDGTIEITDRMRVICDAACMHIAGRGERVLGFADLSLEDRYTKTYPFSVEPPNFPQKGLRFLGFISLRDPPRPQVKEALAKCRSAGIKVIMVTGDHPVTAKAIAQDVGIITTSETVDASNPTERTPLLGNSKAIVVHGSSLREMSNDELDEIIYNYKEIVFARTSPTQKLQIVESCQRLGEIVAATGDGVNDSPALKKADIGISMGIMGSEVSQQSADMILLDDNFASIIIGIEEGRRIFDNLKKSIAYTLASNMPEMIPFLAFIVFNIPLPLGVIAILCIDLLTDMMPAISLAYEKAESDIMHRPPRNPHTDRLVTRKLYFLAYGHIGLIEAAAGFFVYFMVMAEHGFMPDRLIGLRQEWEAQYINDLVDSYGQEWSYEERKVLEYTCYSAIMVSVVVTQWADLIVCKTRHNSIFKQGMSNWTLNFSLIVETALACFLCYCPYMSYLKFYPVRLRWWLYSIPFSILIFIFDEFRKWQIRYNPKGWFRRETYY